MTEQEQLAAEYVLGLLDGEALLEARARLVREPAFADSVAWWEDRLAPMLEELGDAEPPADMLQRVLAAADAQQGGQVIALSRQVRRWRIVSALAATAAVVLAVFAFTLPSAPIGTSPATTTPADSAPLVASVPIGDTPLRLGVTYLPDRQEMLVSASGLTADGVHDHELWLVMPDAPARSLGVVAPGEERRVPVDTQLASAIADGSQLVLTREPLGGAPAGGEAGPVVAQATLKKI
ncbi:anti-sigma factor [Paraurantiacibacter namhicola]|uniref:Anti-sigma-K factor rskA n=1 Tax=Paraurantiacibacter namhicola TaxID=645517 RepID=A0A1C7DB24_9SPHN|nr:anti-sigma factor [Paraurantiacibacter namhicola]ANU08654.1 Anti-sigma-K factor rskA [Paraurantiacibacter namhicola]